MKRNKSIKIRLTEDEFSSLNEKVNQSGFSRERYIRTLIQGAVPKEKPPLDYYQLLNEFNHIGVNLNQLVRQLYNQPLIANDVRTVITHLDELIINLDKQVRVPTK